MNVEIEIKVKINSFEEIKKKLSEYGKLIKSIKQVDEQIKKGYPVLLLEQ